MGWQAISYIRSCRNHLCQSKGVVYNTGAEEKPKCPTCKCKLKPIRNGAAYTGAVVEYNAEGASVSSITPTDNSKLLPPSTLTNHEMSWAAPTGWTCTCGKTFTVYLDKELHLDVNIPGRRRHITHRTTQMGITYWECWCGECFETLGEAGAHDQPMDGKPDPKPAGIASYGPQYHQPSEPVKSTDWSCTDAHTEGCPLPQVSPKLHIPMLMYATWQWLAMRFSTEWIAYLIGKYVDSGEEIGWHVESMYFPKQSAQAAHVQAEDGEIKEGVIGDVHSHVRMGAFFSGEDKAHMNHDVHIVINAKGDMDTSIRTKLECGRFSRTKGSVLFNADPSIQVHSTTLAEILKSRLQR